MLASAHALLDQGQGLLTSLYHSKALLIESAQQGVLQKIKDPEWLKILIKVEKKFPKFPDLAKVSGYEDFLEFCPELLAELEGPYEAVRDAAGMLDTLLLALTDLQPLVTAPHSRQVLWAYIDLFRLFMQLHYVLDYIPEKSMCCMLYLTARRCTDSAFDKNNAQEVQSVLTVLENNNNLHRHLIAIFFPAYPALLAALQVIEPVLDHAKDFHGMISDVFDLHNGQDNPDSLQDPPTCFISIDPSAGQLCLLKEVAHLTAYQDFIVYVCLVCPQFLYQPMISGLLGMVTACRTVLPVFRDISLNIHSELASLSTAYPLPTDPPPLVSIPRGVKLSSLIKGLAKASAASYAQQAFHRREALIHTLQAMLRVAGVFPFVVYTKLPLLLLGGQLLREELVNYTASLAMGGIKREKGCSDLLQGLGVLQRLVSVISSSSAQIEGYYKDFLANQLAELEGAYDMQTEEVKAFLEQIRSLTAAVPSASPCPRAVPHPQMLALDSAHLALISSPKADALSTLTGHAHYAYDLTNTLLSIVPYRVTWYRKVLLDSINQHLHPVGGAGAALQDIFAPLHLLTYTLLNLHPAVPQEARLLGHNTSLYGDIVLRTVTNHLTTSFQSLWDYMQMLSVQTTTSTVGGLESQFANAQQIDKFVILKAALCQLMAAAYRTPPLVIYNKRLFVFEHLLQKLVSHLQASLTDLFAAQRVYRFTSVASKVASAFTTLEIVLRGCNVSVRSIYEDTMSLLLGGATVGAARVGEVDEGTAIHQIAEVFVLLVDSIQGTEGLVYHPHQKLFVNLNPADSQPIEKFLNPTELQALVGLVGVAGVAVIDARLCDIVAEEACDLLLALGEESSYLKLLKSQCLLSVAAATSMKQLPKMAFALKRIGVALVVREMLRSALSAHLHRPHGSQDLISSLTAALEAHSACIDPIPPQCAPGIPHAAPPHPLYSTLLHAMGIADAQDKALTNYLQMTNDWSPEDVELWQLLPIAGAALFTSDDLFLSAQYNSSTQAFSNNQHLLTVALAKLLVVAYDSTPEDVRSMPCSAFLMSYLNYSAQMLLLLKANEMSISDHYPYAGMLDMLPVFVGLTRRFVSFQDLETVLPFVCSHQLSVDLSMGKVRSTDPLLYARDRAALEAARHHNSKQRVREDRESKRGGAEDDGHGVAGEEEIDMIM